MQPVDGQRLQSEVGDEGAPFALGALFFKPVVEECGGEGAGDGEEDQPVSGWKSEAEVW